jgi:hypothetical protein
MFPIASTVTPAGLYSVAFPARNPSGETRTALDPKPARPATVEMILEQELDPANEVVPTGQLLQLLKEVPPDAVLYVPAGQGEQLVAPPFE